MIARFKQENYIEDDIIKQNPFVVSFILFQQVSILKIELLEVVMHFHVQVNLHEFHTIQYFICFMMSYFSMSEA